MIWKNSSTPFSSVFLNSPGWVPLILFNKIVLSKVPKYHQNISRTVQFQTLGPWMRMDCKIICTKLVRSIAGFLDQADLCWVRPFSFLDPSNISNSKSRSVSYIRVTVL